MFITEKGIAGIEQVMTDLTANEHKDPAFVSRNPVAKRVLVLELDDGRSLTETRALCTYLEGLSHEPNLMGATYEERAFIEMAECRIEWYLLGGIANCVRHSHPALAGLEQPPFPEFGKTRGEKMLDVARWMDRELATQPWAAGERFTIADITAFCALEFARGLMKFKPGEAGMPPLQAYRDRIAERATG